MAIPTALQATAAAVVTAARTAIQNLPSGSYNISAMSTSDVISITGAVATWNTNAASYLNSSDPTIAGPTLMADTLIQNVQHLVQLQVTGDSWQVRLFSPNLPQLAQQYYGDASQWGVIAANNGLLDPQPLGLYNLMIPRMS